MKSWWEWQPTLPHCCPLEHRHFTSETDKTADYYEHDCEPGPLHTATFRSFFRRPDHADPASWPAVLVTCEANSIQIEKLRFFFLSVLILLGIYIAYLTTMRLTYPACILGCAL